MAFFEERIEKGVIAKLTGIVDHEFVRMDYTEAFRILETSKQKFEFPVSWGIDLQSEHERYLTEKHVGRPVILMNYPKAIKAFYMRVNDDGRTVGRDGRARAGIGEISRRQPARGAARRARRSHGRERASTPRTTAGTATCGATARCRTRASAWDSSAPSPYATGLSNVRDVIPFPRTPGNARY
jgi:asparaginyl-tRNA synthetase